MSPMTSDTEQAVREVRAVRATTFGAAAGDYDRYRAGVPGEVVERILPAGVGAVLDLGAGTGAMTRRLVERVERVYAVDPDPRMTELLSGNCPGVEVRQGTGEAIPLPDACVDAVVVASAWHWMEPGTAIPEIARVLRPGGVLRIVWNRRDRSVPWVDDFEQRRLDIIGSDDWVTDRIKHYLEEPWLPAGAPLADIEISSLSWNAEMTKEDLVGLITTFHHYIAASSEVQSEMMRRLAEYVDDDERIVADIGGADGRAPLVEVPMSCAVWGATRI